MLHSSNRKLRTIVYILAVVALLFFYEFLNHASKLGGDALAGRVEDGHYYVGSSRGYTEVTFTEYRTNKLLAVAVIIIWPVTILSLIYVERERTKAFERRLKLWAEKLWQGTAPRQKSSKKSRRRN